MNKIKPVVETIEESTDVSFRLKGEILDSPHSHGLTIANGVRDNMPESFFLRTQVLRKTDEMYAKKIKQAYYKGDIFHTWFHSLFLIEKIKETIEKHKVKSVVEVGGGEGYFITKIKCLYPDLLALNTEASLNALKNGRNIFNNENAALADITALPFKDNSFDLVICSEVVEHIPDYRKAISELKRITNKVLLIAVPACHSAKCQRRFVPDNEMKKDGHLHCFMKPDIENELNGLTIKHYYFHSWITRGLLSVCRKVRGKLYFKNPVFIIDLTTYFDYLFSKYLNNLTKSQVFIASKGNGDLIDTSFKYDTKLLHFIINENSVTQNTKNIRDVLHGRIICPHCSEELGYEQVIKCKNCGNEYTQKDGFYDFMVNAAE